MKYLKIKKDFLHYIEKEQDFLKSNEFKSLDSEEQTKYCNNILNNLNKQKKVVLEIINKRESTFIIGNFVTLFILTFISDIINIILLKNNKLDVFSTLIETGFVIFSVDILVVVLYSDIANKITKSIVAKCNNIEKVLETINNDKNKV